ncbi:MAG: hypothetical protein JWR09_995, partial [Mucilaginibacter sp.]|nr:hypothetical protein [Mucilaginibacter sp.]
DACTVLDAETGLGGSAEVTALKFSFSIL